MKWVELVTNLITSDFITNFAILIDGNSEGLSCNSGCCSNKVGADDSGLPRELANLNGTSAGGATSKLTNGKDGIVGVRLVLDLRGRVLRIWTVPVCLVSRSGTRAPGVIRLICRGAAVVLVSWRRGVLLRSLVRGGMMSCRLGSMILC